jgi:hypothetical protein
MPEAKVPQFGFSEGSKLMRGCACKMGHAVLVIGQQVYSVALG